MTTVYLSSAPLDRANLRKAHLRIDCAQALNVVHSMRTVSATLVERSPGIYDARIGGPTGLLAVHPLCRTCAATLSPHTPTRAGQAGASAPASTAP